MSAAAPARAQTRVQTRPQPRGGARPQPARSARPALSLVAPRTARSTAAAPAPLPFALVVAGVLGAGLVALLMLHTLAAQDAFTLHKLQRQSAALGDVQQQLTVANQQAQAPSALAARARALGMVPTGSLRIVRRRDGRIVAVASAVPVPPPTVKASPSPSPSASPTAKAGSSGAGPTQSQSKPAGATKSSKQASGKPRRPH